MNNVQNSTMLMYSIIDSMRYTNNIGELLLIKKLLQNQTNFF